MRILIAEDQFQLRELLQERLEKAGHKVDAAGDGEDAIAYLEAGPYDVVILDIMMPKIDGHGVLRWMRERTLEAPVLFLTAKDAVKDRVEGLHLGADDYLIKPFSFEELLARIHVLTRRKTSEIQEVLTAGSLTLNRATQIVKRGDTVIELTKKEYLILETLLLNKGQTISRERLEMASSNYDYEGYSNVIDVYIRFLRKKIDEGHDDKLIETVRGFGYRLKADV
jgi:DNA-binding response OmpR family regulator